MTELCDFFFSAVLKVIAYSFYINRYNTSYKYAKNQTFVILVQRCLISE